MNYKTFSTSLTALTGEFSGDFAEITSLKRDFLLFYEALNFNFISVQIEWFNVTGTTDGVVALKQSNGEGLTPIEIPTLTGNIDSVDGSLLLETSEWGGKSLFLEIKKGSITGGTFKCAIVLKRK